MSDIATDTVNEPTWREAKAAAKRAIAARAAKGILVCGYSARRERDGTRTITVRYEKGEDE